FTRTSTPIGAKAMIDLLELLKLRGFGTTQRTKLVRHKDPAYDIHLLLRRGWLEPFQCFQNNPVFNDTDYVVSFVGTTGTKARLLGIYAVLGRQPGSQGSLPADCRAAMTRGEINDQWSKAKYFYDLRKQPGFEDLEGRVVIDWGKAAKSWHQWLRKKEVVEV